MYALLVRIFADGSLVAIFVIAVLSFALLIPRKKWLFWGWRIVAAGITSYATAKIIGFFYQPETLRPFEKLGVEPLAAFLPNPGFPSDHMLFATFLLWAVWFSTKNKPVTITLVALTVLMGIARVLALVHTPADVIGGAIIGSVGIFWYFYGQKPKKPVK